MIVTAHQPEFMSYLGYFDKICKADKLVILDSVAYRKNYFQNRNQILGKDGQKWITIPVEKYSLGTPINKIKIRNDLNWKSKMIKTIKQAYSKAKFFDQFYPDLEKLLISEDDHLKTYNLRILDFYLNALDIKVEQIMSSSLDLQHSKDEMVLELCMKTNAKVYIAGISGKDYLNETEFERNGIQIYHHEYVQQEYKQYSTNFVGYMSVLDGLMHEGSSIKNKLNKHI